MAEVINLRSLRKAKARNDKAAAAEANRLAFGRTKADKSMTARQRDVAARHLDGHRLGRSDGDADG